MNNELRLSQENVALSEGEIWPRAKLEWFLEAVYFEEEPNVCLCGHFPILEICILRNRLNGNSATVGNVCVKKFLGLPSDKIFQAVKRVRKDKTKSFNAEAINHALQKHWINKWEHDFYMNIMRKRAFTPRQFGKKQEINKKLLSHIVNARPDA